MLGEFLDGEIGVKVFHGCEGCIGVCEAGVLEAGKGVMVTGVLGSAAFFPVIIVLEEWETIRATMRQRTQSPDVIAQRTKPTQP